MRPRDITWKAVQRRTPTDPKSPFQCEETCARAGLRAINTWTDGTLLCRVSRTTGETKRTYLGEWYRQLGTSNHTCILPSTSPHPVGLSGESLHAVHVFG